MNFKKLLPISLISLGMLIGCGGDQGGGSTFPQDHEDGVHTIELNQEKLTELKAIWYDDGNARNVQDAIVSIKENGQEQNIAKAVASKKLTLAVEKEDVLAVAGMTITPKAIDAQTKACKVAVKYYDTVKSFEVTITHRKTPKEYGAKHDGTAADPMDNEDLITVAKAQKAEGGFAPVEYYAKGEVESFYKSQLPDSGQNVVSFYYKPAEGKTEKFEVYKAKYDGKPTDFKWTSQDIWAGATVTAKGKFKEYNNQFEFDPSTVTKVEGEPPAPPATIEVNVAQALQKGASLANNESTYDYYQITGLVKAIVTPFDPTSQYKQITVTMVDALTDETGVDTYRLACTEEQAAKFLYGSTLVAKGKLMKYNDKIQLAQGCEIISISGGEAWPSHDEPTLVTGKTVAEFLADTAGKGKQLYEIKGVITRWADNATDASAYGNFFIKDETDTSETPTEIYVYGATATATALTWDRTAGIYTFKNPQDFLTNDMTKLAAIGGKITIKLTRCDYNETKEGQGIVTDVEGYDPAVPPDPPVGDAFAVYDFSSLTAKGTGLTLDTLNSTLAATKTSGAGSLTATALEKVYDGNGSGGAKANTAGLLKLGTGSVNGSMTFTVSEEITKVVINCHSFYAYSEQYPSNTTNFIKVNGGTAVALPYNATAAGEDLEFTVTGTSLTIETYNPNPSGNTTAGRGYIYSITLYK